MLSPLLDPMLVVCRCCQDRLAKETKTNYDDERWDIHVYVDCPRSSKNQGQKPAAAPTELSGANNEAA